MRLKLTLIILSLFLLPLISAQTIPSYQQNTNITLSVPCYLNGDACPGSVVCEATILAPSGSVLYNTETMIKDGTLYTLNLSITDTSQAGQYELGISCCQGSNCNDRQLQFFVTPSGAPPISSGQGFTMIGVFAILLLINGLFYFIGFRMENKDEHMAGRLLAFGLGAVMTLGIGYYAMLIVTESFAQAPAFITALTVFMYIFRILAIILLVLAFFIVFAMVLRNFKIRRGLIDP